MAVFELVRDAVSAPRPGFLGDDGMAFVARPPRWRQRIYRRVVHTHFLNTEAERKELERFDDLWERVQTAWGLGALNDEDSRWFCDILDWVDIWLEDKGL